MFLFLHILKVADKPNSMSSPDRDDIFIKNLFDAVSRSSILLIHRDYQELHRRFFVLSLCSFCPLCAKNCQKKRKKTCSFGRRPSAELPNCFCLSSYVLNYTTLISGIIFRDEKADMAELCKQRWALGQRVGRINRLWQTC